MKLRSQDKIRIREQYGEWALVTGATSGLGRELAFCLASCGLNLLVCSRKQKNLERLQKEITAQHATEVRIYPADLSTEEGLSRLIRETRSLDIGLLVAAAGYGSSGLFYENKLYTERNMLLVNCEAPLILCHHFSERFVERKRGGILLFSSIVAFQGVPLSAHYAATKAYIQSLAEGLVSELKPLGVDVLAVSPGPVHSGFGLRAGMKMSLAAKPETLGVPILR